MDLNRNSQKRSSECNTVISIQSTAPAGHMNWSRDTKEKGKERT